MILGTLSKDWLTSEYGHYTYLCAYCKKCGAEARRTTILQPVEPHSQKDRQDEKAEGYVPDEGTR